MKSPSLQKLEAFYDRLDSRTALVLKEWQGCVKCRKGCDLCCTGVPVRKVELDYLRKGLEDRADADLLERLGRMEFHADGSGFTGQAVEGPAGEDGNPEYRCVFLSAPVEGHCLVYPWRPLICRVHGLPLLYPMAEYDVSGTRIDTPENREYALSWCDLNLEGVGEEEVLLRGYLPMEDLEQELDDLDRQGQVPPVTGNQS